MFALIQQTSKLKLKGAPGRIEAKPCLCSDSGFGIFFAFFLFRPGTPGFSSKLPRSFGAMDFRTLMRVTNSATSSASSVRTADVAFFQMYVRDEMNMKNGFSQPLP